MQNQEKSLVWGLVMVVLTLVAVGAARAANPDLANVDDMLNGRWTINPVDDLVAADPVRQGNQFSAFNYWFYTSNNRITSYTEPPQNVINTSGCSFNFPLPQQTRVGRMFALKNDVIITVFPGAFNLCIAFGVQVKDPVSGSSKEIFFQASPNWLQVAVADFNKDGYDELVVINQDTMYLITAVNVTDMSKGLKVVKTLALGNDQKKPMSQPVVGDFDNDGIPEVAWVGASGPGGDFTTAGSMQVYFASVCLLPNAHCTTNALTLRSKTIDLGASNSSAGGTNYCTSTSALAAGDFFPGASGGDELLIALTKTAKAGDPPARCSVSLYSYAFDTSLTPQKKHQQDNVYQSDNNASDNVQVFAAAARLDWFGGDGDQVVLAFSSYQISFPPIAVREVWTVTFDNDGTMTYHQSSTVIFNSFTQIWGLAVGRFTTATDTADQFNPRIATLSADEADLDLDIPTFIHFYSLKDPSAGDFTPQFSDSDAFKFTTWRHLTFAKGFGNNLLQAGDLQGRSMRVGAPLVARITNHLQPRMILSVPPMHVDYVRLQGASQPAVVNFSVTPASFFASYNTSQVDSSQSSTTETTSYSWAMAESVAVNFKASIPFVQGISGTNQEAWGQTYDREVSSTYDTFSSVQFDASGATYFSDVVWFSKEDFNVYYYPVFGQTVCPQESPNCSPAEQQPLYAVVSGPSNSTEYQIEGSTLEWYQPVHEPGNIFSYPWDETQLSSELGGDLIVLSRGTAFATDAHPASYATLWTGAQGAEKTAGTTAAHSFSSSTSLTMGTPNLDDAAGGANVTVGFDYSNSNSVSTLNTRVTSVGKSTGVAGEKPGTFRDPSLYQYLFQPFIFGETPPEGSVQNLNPNVDIATNGVLQTQYVADPVDIAATGAWWSISPYYDYIDVALNHPRLWVVSEADQSGTLPLECLSGPQCVTGRVPDPTNLWTSPFYWMRGLYVTLNGINGPQRTQATEGDTVFLQARVYNYSLKAMPANSEVHAGFYRQEWDTKTNTPIGDSVLIEDVLVTNANGGHVIPPFKSGLFDVYGHELPNWVLAGTSFDTTGLSGRNFIFWVVVWAEDTSGKLIAELPGHGLTAKPGTLTSIGAAPLETVTVTYASTGKTVTTSFSNNVGFLKQAFYVASTTEAPAPTGGAQARLQLQQLKVTPTKVAPNQQVIVRVDVLAKGAMAKGVVVMLVDEETKRVVDMDLLSHIPANGKHHVAIPYETGTCGTRKLRLLVEPGTTGRKESTTSFKVECEVKQ